MNVEIFEMNKHYKQIIDWCLQRDIEPPHPTLLPEAGFIVSGVVAVFLYKTDSSVCFIEWLISNKACDRSQMLAGKKMVIDAALLEAKKFGFKVVMVATKIKSVADTAISYGFKDRGSYTLLEGGT